MDKYDVTIIGILTIVFLAMFSLVSYFHWERSPAQDPEQIIGCVTSVSVAGLGTAHRDITIDNYSIKVLDLDGILGNKIHINTTYSITIQLLNDGNYKLIEFKEATT